MSKHRGRHWLPKRVIDFLNRLHATQPHQDHAAFLTFSFYPPAWHLNSTTADDRDGIQKRDILHRRRYQHLSRVVPHVRSHWFALISFAIQIYHLYNVNFCSYIQRRWTFCSAFSLYFFCATVVLLVLSFTQYIIPESACHPRSVLFATPLAQCLPEPAM